MLRKFLAIGITLILFGIVAEKTKAQDGPPKTQESPWELSKNPYNCVRAAAATILRYFGHAESFEDISRIIPMDQKGFSKVSDFCDVCEQRGLHCRAFRNLTFDQVVENTSAGRVVVVVFQLKDQQHAVSLFDHGGEIWATDLLIPPHAARLDHLRQYLLNGAICVIVGEQTIPTPEAQWQWPALFTIPSAFITFFLFRRFQ